VRYEGLELFKMGKRLASPADIPGVAEGSPPPPNRPLAPLYMAVSAPIVYFYFIRASVTLESQCGTSLSLALMRLDMSLVCVPSSRAGPMSCGPLYYNYTATYNADVMSHV